MMERGFFLLVYTTTKSEIPQDEYLMGIVRTRTKEACALPREYGPVNWYGSPLDTSGMPICYSWSVSSLRAYPNDSLRALRGHAKQDNSFKMIKIPARYWRAAIGLARAKPTNLVERGYNEQFCYRDHFKLGVWIYRTSEDRQTGSGASSTSRGCTSVEPGSKRNYGRRYACGYLLPCEGASKRAPGTRMGSVASRKGTEDQGILV